MFDTLRKKYDVTLKLPIDRVLNTEHFYGKITQKMCTKASPGLLFNFAE